MEIKDLILFAYPLGGKDTQTDLCINFYKNLLREFLVVSTGGIFRKLGDTNYSVNLLKETMNCGKLAPDFIATGLVINILINELTQDKALIFNGYPRTKEQGKELVRMMEFYKRKPVIVIIRVSEEEIIKRLAVRQQKECRIDDSIETVRTRLKIFDEEFLPLYNYLKEHYEVVEIDGNQDPESIHRLILGTIM